LVLLKVGLSRDADRVARQRGEAMSRWAFPLGFIKWKPSVDIIISFYRLRVSYYVISGWTIFFTANEMGNSTILRC
jgi:hypothetical protein